MTFILVRPKCNRLFFCVGHCAQFNSPPVTFRAFCFLIMRKLTNILLNFGNYVPYNVELAKALGGAEIAIMLSVLINRYNYYFNEGKLDSDGFFYCTAETLEDISAIGGGGKPQIGAGTAPPSH